VVKKRGRVLAGLLCLPYLGAIAWGIATSASACSEAGSDLSDAGNDGALGDAELDSGHRLEGGGDSAGPSLIDLRVSRATPSDASPPVALVPAYSASIHDYYVRCSAGVNALEVTLVASNGADSLITAPFRSMSSPNQTVLVNVSENQALVAAATDGLSTSTYWIRCLPHDFPRLEWTPHPDAGRPSAGYYLLGTQNVVDGAGYAMVLDANGVPVWYLRQTTGVFDVDSVVDGSISFAPFPLPLDPFEIVTFHPLSTTDLGSNVDPHELRSLPNGDFLIIGSDLQMDIDLSGLTLPLLDGGSMPLGPHSTIRACDVYEVDPKGNVVWTWVATDHFDAVKDSTWPQPAAFTGIDGGLFLESFDGGPIVDPFHCNSIDVDPANGNLLLSARHMDSVFYLARSSGKVVWKMGGASYTKDDATYVEVADPFYRQHDARLLPGWSSTCGGGAGTVSMFDDETEMAAPARGVIYRVQAGGGDGDDAGSTACDGEVPDGGITGTAVVDWQLKGATMSSYSGSLRVASDGSRLVGWGASGVLDLVSTEVDVHGHDLVDLLSPDDIVSYRVVKVPPSTFDLSALRSASGVP
jgi:hypothetical protein